MQSLTVILLYSIAVALCVMMLKQGLSRSVEIFSMRNLYLAGFIVYQLMSPANALRSGQFAGFRISAPDRTGQAFLLMAIVFLFVFLLSYHKIKICRFFARKFPVPQREISDSFFLGLAIFLVCIAVPLRFIGPSIPLVAKVSVQTAIALAAVACGIAGWVWGNRRLNPAVIAMMVAIVGPSLFIGMSGVFGRRPMLSMLLGIAWGAYYRRARYMNPAKLLLTLSPVLLFVIVTVSAFTAIRQTQRADLTDVQSTVRQMTNANVQSGAGNLLSGQAVGSAALWAAESWPDKFETRPLWSLRMIGWWYVPRYFWPEKPVPLGNDVARLARLEGVNWDKIKILPGVVGYGAAEGGILAVIIYALFFGQFIRFTDELVRLNPTNAFIILPLGVATGQVLGLARGCIAIFTNLIVLGFVTTFVLLFVASKLFGQKVQPTYWAPWPQPQ